VVEVCVYFTFPVLVGMTLDNVLIGVLHAYISRMCFWGCDEIGVGVCCEGAAVRQCCWILGRLH
jgi:hypothetical protein